MKKIAAIAALLLLLAFPVASRADTIASGVTLSLTAGADSYTFLESTPGTFVAVDGVSTITAVYAGTPAGDTFNVTDVCLAVAPFTACKTYTLSITDANFTGVALDASVDTDAAAHTSLGTNLATISLTGSTSLGTDTLVFSGAPDTGVSPDPGTTPTSPTPEAATFSLMATGLLGGAGILRRRKPLV